MTDSLPWTLERSHGYHVVAHAYVDLMDDLVVGTVLSQIAYWYKPGKTGKTKLRVIKHGQAWLAKSRLDWAAECRISPKQFDRAIKRLCEAGLVKVQVMRFNALPTLHLWLDVPALTNALVGQLTKGEIRSCPKGKSHIDLSGTSLTETTTETTDNETTAAVAAPGSPTAEVIYLPVGEAMKASDILKHHKQKQAQQVAPGAPPLATALLWTKLLAEYHPGFHKPLTSKERALLKQVHEQAGPAMPDLLRWTLAHWTRFGFEVGHQRGVKTIPDTPTVWFFRNHYDLALQLIAKPEALSAPGPAVVAETIKPKAAEKTSSSALESAMAELQQLKGG